MPTRADIRSWIREQTLLEVDDVESSVVDDWINQGIRETAAIFDWPWLTTTSTITTIADQQAYNMPSDLGRIEVIIDTDSRRRLEEYTPAEMWDRYGGNFPSAEPSKFFVWGDQIHLVPIPSSGETDALTIYYYGSPTLLNNDSDEPQFDPRFHLLLAEYGIWQAWKREEEYAKAEEAKGRFDAGIERMARHYLDRANDQPFVFGGGRMRGASIRDRTPWIDDT